MLLADSSVWIDFFNGVERPETHILESKIPTGGIWLGDLIAAEVLQGIDSEPEFERVTELFTTVPQLTICDAAIAVQAARNFRQLRSMGITIRKTIDTLIATRCIVDGYALLFSDRDFQPFVDHLGLASATGA